MLPANWGINFCRNHSTGGSSTWGRIGSTFHDPAHFNRFKGFGTIPGIVAASAHFSDTEAVQELDEGAFWKNEKTLYSELFTDQDSPLKGHGAYIWLTPLDSMNNTLFGLHYGAEYSKAEMLEELRKHNIHPFCRYGDVPHYADWAKKPASGLRFIFAITVTIPLHGI